MTKLQWARAMSRIEGKKSQVRIGDHQEIIGVQAKLEAEAILSGGERYSDYIKSLGERVALKMSQKKLGKK